MKAAALAGFGPPDVLRLTEVDTPAAGPGQVRVTVKAAGVQPIDCVVRSGTFRPPWLTDVAFPLVVGNEFAGVVDQVGDGVTGVSVGDEVVGYGTLRCYAEYVVVPADQVVPKPANMPWEIAGGFTSGAQTAHIALTDLGVAAGSTVLVHAAAGAVGTMAVQLARVLGAARVIGTASPANHDYLRALGATPVAYGPGLLDRVRELAPDGIQSIVDGAGGPALDVSLELVPADRIRELVDHARAESLGVPVLKPLRSGARLAELVGYYADGRLTAHIRQLYPLADAASAHRDVEGGHGAGKVVLTI